MAVNDNIQKLYRPLLFSMRLQSGQETAMELSVQIRLIVKETYGWVSASPASGKVIGAKDPR